MAWKRHKGAMGGIEIAKHDKSVTRNWIFDSLNTCDTGTFGHV